MSVYKTSDLFSAVTEKCCDFFRILFRPKVLTLFVVFFFSEPLVSVLKEKMGVIRQPRNVVIHTGASGSEPSTAAPTDDEGSVASGKECRHPYRGLGLRALYCSTHG